MTVANLIPPFPCNTNYDWYDSPANGGGVISVANVCFLCRAMPRGRLGGNHTPAGDTPAGQAGGTEYANLHWTHYAFIGSGVFVKSGWNGKLTAYDDTQRQSLWIPNHGAGVEYKVVFAEIVGRNTHMECRKVYLARQAGADKCMPGVAGQTVLPVPSNTKADWYSGGASQQNAMGIYLAPSAQAGRFGASDSPKRDTPAGADGGTEYSNLRWTHRILFPAAYAVADGWQGKTTAYNDAARDSFWVPDNATGVEFKVSFVEIAGLGTATEHKIAWCEIQNTAAASSGGPEPDTLNTPQS